MRPSCVIAGRHLVPSRSSIFNPVHTTFLAGASTLLSIPNLGGVPEVIVTGRANVGKSSLINTVLHKAGLFHASKKAGRTRQLNFAKVGPGPHGRLVVVDAPGYGNVGKSAYGELFDQYLQTRAELRRVYVLFKAKNGLNYYDEAMLAHLGTLCNRDTKEQQERGLKPFTIQPILTQLDNIPTKDIQQTVAQLRVQIADLAPNGLLPPILTCALNTPFGLDEVRKSILEACSVEEDQQE